MLPRQTRLRGSGAAFRVTHHPAFLKERCVVKVLVLALVKGGLVNANGPRRDATRAVGMIGSEANTRATLWCVLSDVHRRAGITHPGGEVQLLSRCWVSAPVTTGLWAG